MFFPRKKKLYVLLLFGMALLLFTTACFKKHHEVGPKSSNLPQSALDSPITNKQIRPPHVYPPPYSGTNLALTASAQASCYVGEKVWTWEDFQGIASLPQDFDPDILNQGNQNLYQTWGFWATPDRGINGNLNDWWFADSSRFYRLLLINGETVWSNFEVWGEWFQINWPNPITVTQMRFFGIVMATWPIGEFSIFYLPSENENWVRMNPSSISEWYPLDFENNVWNWKEIDQVDGIFRFYSPFGIIKVEIPPTQIQALKLKFWPARAGLAEAQVFGPVEEAGWLRVVQPADGSVFSQGQPIEFRGEATGTVTNLRWTSNISGSLATDTLQAIVSNLPPGTHTITLSAQSSTGQPLSHSVGILVREATLTIDLTLDPPEVRPTGTTNSVPTTVTVTVTSGGRPVSNHPILATATPIANSGGHFHDGNRPIGAFNPPSGNTLANGVFTTIYTPSQFGGTETIIICSGINSEAQVSRDLTVRVPGLILLPDENYYVQIGGTIHHPGPPMPNVDNFNHYGRPEIIQAIQQLAGDFNAIYRVRPPLADLLQFNDISLPYGGVFDIRGTWATNYHADHREGINVDFNHRPLNNEQRDWLRRQIRDRFGEPPHPHPRPPAETHWHLVYARPLQGEN